jgi:hypothetical protein
MKRFRRFARLCIRNAIPLIFFLGLVGLAVLYLGIFLDQLSLMLIGSVLVLPLLSLLALLGLTASFVVGLVLVLAPLGIMVVALQEFFSTGTRASTAQETGDAE